ncbi:MAG: hypothetical protein DMG12_08130 [Acidobacteria bacterium]|nr:MAG: hypothetical protein DMG12_08130 [Acidobacteriota bacterium]
MAALFLVFGWFGWQLQSIEWQSTDIPAVNAWLAATALRQFWNAHAGEFLAAFLSILCFSALVWFSLEAFFRRRIVRSVLNGHVVAGLIPRSPGFERGLKPATTCAFKVFLGSSVLKSMVLGTAALLIILIAFVRYPTIPLAEWSALWLETRGIAVAGLVIFAALAFLLTVFETLLRSDALDLLGTDLIRVTGLIGTLLLFESLIGASFLIAVIAGFLHVARATEAIMMFAMSVLVMFILSVFHSYLLLVRFSTVGIMRRNVIDV